MKLDTQTFIDKARTIHGEKYDYSKVNYVNGSVKVCIVCPEHGEFWQLPHSHFRGSGCPECARLKRSSSSDFIDRARKVHGDKYDYSKVQYVNKETKICIICPEHGEFWQRPHNHIREAQGCPICGKKYAKEWRKYNYDLFISESNKRFGNAYSFPHIEDEYENSHSKVTIKCNKCGNEFTKIACDHITSPNGGCQHCYWSKSKPEEEIGNFIIGCLEDDSNIAFNDRELLNHNEIDIFVRDKRLAIEFNGLYWHSNKDKDYHLLKTEACNKLGIKMIQIFEDEYKFHKNIVLSKLKHLFGKDYDLPKIHGKQCTVKEIAPSDASCFLNNNHINGNCKASLFLGAFYADVLCGVLTAHEKEDDKWVLTRFATDITKLCVGVVGKMFSHFMKTYNPQEVETLADRRWVMDEECNIYHKLGFKLEETLAPDYCYYVDGEDKRIPKLERIDERAAKKIWDCGFLKYIWKKS